MKKVIRYFGMALLLGVMTGVLGSCIKEKMSTPAAETANIIVKLDSRAQGDVSTDDPNALENEGIESVRLILVQGGKIVINQLFEGLSGENEKLLEKGFQIIGLKKETTDFYAVVNMPSVGKDFNVGGNLGELNAELAGFPCEYKGTEILPMYGKETNKEILHGANISIKVTRAVARIDLSITNETGADLNISSVDFGSFFANKGYLVSSEGNGITYMPRSFENFGNINNEQTVTKSYYLYEALVSYESFTIGLKSGDFEYEKKKIEVEEEQKANLLKRNTVLKINATVSKGPSNATCATINCSVAPWEAVELGPTFE